MLTDPELASGAQQNRTVDTGNARAFEPVLTLADIRSARREFIAICGVLIGVSTLIGVCLIALSVLFTDPGSASVASKFVGGAGTLFGDMKNQGWAALGALAAAAIPIALVARQVSEDRHPDAATYVGGDVLQGAASILGVASVVSAFAIAASGEARWFALTNIVAVLVSLALVALAAFAKMSLDNWELQAVAVAAEMRVEEYSRLVEVRARRERRIKDWPWGWCKGIAIVVVLVAISVIGGMAARGFALPAAEIVGLLVPSTVSVAIFTGYAIFVSAQLQMAWDRRNYASLIVYSAIALVVLLSQALLVLEKLGDPLAGAFGVNIVATLALVAVDRRTRGPATAYALRALDRRINRLAKEGIPAAGQPDEGVG